MQGGVLSSGPSQPNFRPTPSGPRPAQVVVVGDKAWCLPHPDNAGKPAGGSISKPHTPSGSHSMINVDARSAPKGAAPAPMQRYPSADMRPAESQPEQGLAARERSAFSPPAFAPTSAPSQPLPHSASRSGLTPRIGQPSSATHTRWASAIGHHHISFLELIAILMYIQTHTMPTVSLLLVMCF